MRQKILVNSKLLLLALVLLILSANAQDFQIRTRVDLVVVPFTVKGPNDELISGLQKEDFILLEDGREIRLHCIEELVDAGFDDKQAVDTVTLCRRGVELHIGAVALIMNLAKDEFEEFPEGLWLL